MYLAKISSKYRTDNKKLITHTVTQINYNLFLKI